MNAFVLIFAIAITLATFVASEINDTIASKIGGYSGYFLTNSLMQSGVQVFTSNKLGVCAPNYGVDYIIYSLGDIVDGKALLSKAEFHDINCTTQYYGSSIYVYITTNVYGTDGQHYYVSQNLPDVFTASGGGQLIS